MFFTRQFRGTGVLLNMARNLFILSGYDIFKIHLSVKVLIFASAPQKRYTPQEPPNPMRTLPSSTITGTSRFPLVKTSISDKRFASFLTLR
jgi:hypothetical protein